MCEKMIETLLQHGLIVNPRDVDNPRLLNTAVEKSYLKIVEDLLEYGAAVNMLTTSRFGRRCTPLHSAVYGKQVEMAKLLINYRANVNIKNADGKAPLVCAIQTRNTEMIELLLINGADVKRDPEVLCTAAEYGCFKLVEDLLKDGFDVNKFTSKFGGCYMPLHTAVLAKQSEMVELLIKNGANVNIKDAKGITPLVCAIQTMNTKMIKLLVINGADIKEDPTLLCIAIKSSGLNIVEGLFKNGADVNRSPGSSCFAVIPNAMHGKQVEVAKLLINYGAKVNITDAEGITPLVCAIKTRNTKLIELLLINGADIKGDPKLLCTAVEYECLKIVEELLKYGADVNKLTTSGFGRGITPLHSAVHREQVKMAELLINYGANVNIKDAEGKTPLHDAIKNSDTKMIELLLINGADIRVDLDLLFMKSKSMNRIKQHIAKAKAAGLHLIVSEINLLWLKDREIKNFLILCEAEIKIMKSEMMGNSCSSFYDILIKDISQLARNESIVWALNYDDYKTKFPIYASMIDSRRRRLVERGVLLKQVRNKVLHSFFKSLPVLCTEKIFSYLNDRDLRILLAA